MDALDLKLICSADTALAGQFKGVYSYDNLPPTISAFPSAYICNTDKTTGRGKHWVAIHFDSDKKCSFFDSYGIKPLGRFRTFTLHNSNGPVVFNKKWLQAPTSHNCGLYVLYFLFHAARGVTLEVISGWPFEEFAWGCNDSVITEWARRLINNSDRVS